jgi:putative ABC transport system ATP-binding protein
MNELIKLENLNKIYPDGNVQALSDINLSIQANEYIAIMGPSGSGKSTLLNILGGLDKPTSGTISFKGKPYSAIKSLDYLRAHYIGIVFQSFYLLPSLTALENVQMPMFETNMSARAKEEKAKVLLEHVGLSHRMDHLPTHLSVGERQRVAIARSLANDPELLLADEPTGNLDSQTAQEVLALFDTLKSKLGHTIIVVTHDMRVAARAGRIIHLLDGRVK